MAVTIIRKISSWSFLTVALITIVVLGIYYLGGVVDSAAEIEEPVYTDMLLNWTYIVLGITTFAFIFFGAWGIKSLLQEEPRKAIFPLSLIGASIVILAITFSMGNSTPLNLIGYDGKQNVEFWLKLTDMWLYTIYLEIATIIMVLAYFWIKKLLDK